MQLSFAIDQPCRLDKSHQSACASSLQFEREDCYGYVFDGNPFYALVNPELRCELGKV